MKILQTIADGSARITALALLFAAMALGVAGCDQNEGPVEEAAEAVDEQAEEAGDAVEDAADDVEDSLDD